MLIDLKLTLKKCKSTALGLINKIDDINIIIDKINDGLCDVYQIYIKSSFSCSCVISRKWESRRFLMKIINFLPKNMRNDIDLVRND